VQSRRAVAIALAGEPRRELNPCESAAGLRVALFRPKRGRARAFLGDETNQEAKLDG
jgi:hypothetical protein